MFVNKTLLSPLKIGLVSDAADVSLWVPVSMESFHDVSIQTVKKSHSPLSQPRVQDHGELLSARLSPGNHYKFQWAYADEMRNFPRVHSYDPFVTTINQRKNEKWMSLCCISFFLLDRYPCTGDAYIWSKQTDALSNGNRNLISPKSMMLILLSGVSLARPCVSHSVSRCAWAFTPDQHI